MFSSLSAYAKNMVWHRSKVVKIGTVFIRRCLIKIRSELRRRKVLDISVTRLLDKSI
jgi:hypothetical protein